MSGISKKIQQVNFYEIVSYVVGIIALFLTITLGIDPGKDWKDYCLIGSGWLASLMFCFLVRRISKISEENHSVAESLKGDINLLNEKNKYLQDELNRAHQVSYFLTSVNQMPSATPRAPMAATVDE